MSETLHMCCPIAMHRIEIERVVGRGWGLKEEGQKGDSCISGRGETPTGL